jgi:hypothetical protein
MCIGGGQGLAAVFEAASPARQQIMEDGVDTEAAQDAEASVASPLPATPRRSRMYAATARTEALEMARGDRRRRVSRLDYCAL